VFFRLPVRGIKKLRMPQKRKSRPAWAHTYGLRGRLILLVFISIVPALVLILHNAKRDRDVSAGRIQEDARQIVEIASARQARFIDAARQLLAVLAEGSEVASGDPLACNRFVKGLTDRTGVYVNLGRIDLDGNLVCSAIGFSGNLNLAEHSYFRRARDSKDFAIGDYQIGKVTGRASVNFGYPVLNGSGEVTAVMYAALDLTWLTRLTAEARLPEGASLSILDSQGTILARFPDPEQWVGKPVPDAPLFQLLQLGNHTAQELTGVDGVKRLYAFTVVSGQPQTGQIYIVVGIPKETAFAQVNRTLQRNLAWLGVACLLALATAWFIGNRYVVDYVHEHARAEEARLRLASIVESSQDAIIGKSLDGTIVSWNDGAEMMYGYTADEVKGRPITILNPPDRPNEIPQLLEIVRQGKGLNRYETERIRKDGRRLYVSASLSPIRDYEGTVIGASTIGRDITALRKVEEKLRAHASQMETLYTMGQQMGRTLALEEVIQQALDGVVLASGFDVALIHLQGKSSVPMVFAARRVSPWSPEPTELLARLGKEFERRIITCNEPWFVEDAAVVPELRQILDFGGMRAWVVLPLSGGEQRRGTLTLMSPRFHDLGAEESQFLQALAQQIALAIENAELYGATAEMNAHLQEEVEERKRAEKTLADFTAMVVHDLRSPLSNVVSISESLQGGLFGPVNEQQNKWLGKIETNCRSLIDHVSDFLDLSKIEAGHIELLKKPVNLEALLKESLVEHTIEANKRDIPLRSQIDNPLPTLWVDSRRLNQVLSNLLSNAFKFSDDGTGIEVGARQSGGNEVVVWVKDRGVGIPNDEIGHIFEKYRQLSSRRESGHRGTGLGLVICKKIVEAHGGRIWAESEEGKGATFLFSLPVKASGAGANWRNTDNGSAE
jgi:PAS domain S-box-containing protein